MKKLLLTSGGISNPVIRNKFIEMVKKAPQDIKIVFVSSYDFLSDQDDSIHYYDPKNVFFRERKLLIDFGFLPENLFEYCLGNEWNHDIEKYDAIYFNGGNLRRITSRMAKTGFGKVVDTFVDNGGVYIGISAGSYLALTNKSTLGYIDCKIHVHCEKGSQLGVVDKTKKDVSLTNSQALCVINDEWVVIE